MAARINFDAWILDDSRFHQLLEVVKCSGKFDTLSSIEKRIYSHVFAVGLWIKAIEFFQNFVSPENPRGLSPIHKWQQFDFHDWLDKAQVTQSENGQVEIIGAEKQFAWLVSRKSNGKKGGRPRKTIPKIVENNHMDNHMVSGLSHFTNHMVLQTSQQCPENAQNVGKNNHMVNHMANHMPNPLSNTNLDRQIDRKTNFEKLKEFRRLDFSKIGFDCAYSNINKTIWNECPEHITPEIIQEFIYKFAVWYRKQDQVAIKRPRGKFVAELRKLFKLSHEQIQEQANDILALTLKKNQEIEEPVETYNFQPTEEFFATIIKKEIQATKPQSEFEFQENKQRQIKMAKDMLDKGTLRPPQ